MFVKMGCEEKIGGEEGWHSKMENGTWRGCVGIERREVGTIGVG